MGDYGVFMCEQISHTRDLQAVLSWGVCVHASLNGFHHQHPQAYISLKLWWNPKILKYLKNTRVTRITHIHCVLKMYSNLRSPPIVSGYVKKGSEKCWNIKYVTHSCRFNNVDQILFE